MRLHNSIAITAALVISSAFSAAAQKTVKVDMKDGMGSSVGMAGDSCGVDRQKLP